VNTFQEYQCQTTSADEQGGTLVVRLSSDRAFDYKAGQYLWLEVCADDFRPFSIASNPSQHDFLELHIRILADNPNSLLLRERLLDSNPIRARLASGRCTLERIEQKRPILFVAGGTGYAPCHAMIQELISQDRMPETHLFWGAANKEELYLEQMPVNWSKDVAEFSFTPVVQNKTEPYESGLVHEVVLRKIKNLQNYDIYLAGSKPMVDAVLDSLVAAGAIATQVFSDMLDLEEQ